MMKAAKTTALMRRTVLFLFAAGLLSLAAGCGGGGGGGGGGTSSSLPGGPDGITLMSITFPDSTNLTGATPNPPSSAPLGQQVIFTFSDVPEGPDEVIVDLVLEDGYDGPDVIVDFDKNVIPARGTFEKLDNLIVFTPYFPTEPFDLSTSAQKEAVPGLLPDMEYIVFVPIGIGGSISNLKAVDPSVTNPIRFQTCSGELPTFFYGNHPAEIPRVVAHYPADGAVDVPINTYGDVPQGFPAKEEFFIEFDQPLFYSGENVQGEDLDGDGVDEENMYFLYTGPEYFAALDTGFAQLPGIYSVNRKTGAQVFVGETKLAVSPYTTTGLRSVVIDGAGRMLGSDGATLYVVEYKDLLYPDVCRLFLPLSFGGRTDVRGLSFGPDGTLFALDGSTGELLTVDSSTGGVTVIMTLDPLLGEWKDLAACADGTLYATAVFDSGQPTASSTVQSIDLDTPDVATIFAGSGDYTSISMMGFSRLSLYSGPGVFVDVLDLETGQLIVDEHYTIAGLDDGALLNVNNTVAELGTWADLVENTYLGSRVVLEPSGILPFGERIEFLIRRGLDNISNGSIAANEGQGVAEADRIAVFRTFDPDPPVVVDDRYFEDFLDRDGEGNAMQEGLPPANWAVQDVDLIPPEYEHLLATYGLSGGGGLGDFKPLGIYPTVILDTDFQTLPLYDGSTPDVKKHTVVEGGIFNFHDIILPDGVTVKGIGSNPLILTATGRVEIAGTIDVSGADGIIDVTFDSAFTPVPGGLGGPGGGRGGVSHPAKPEDFQLLIDLRSPFASERGWGYSNLRQAGGRGAESGASGTDTKYLGGRPGEDDFSRASGGGGGSFFQEGGKGYHGFGSWGADPYSPERYFQRELWLFYDGHPNPTPGVNTYMTQDPPGGDPGDWSFSDGNPDNDFIGPAGEVTFIQGGQGGGGGGTRLDSMNPATIGLAAGWWPAVDRSAYDAKGGGGGGGGGSLGIYALGRIDITATGVILARGGQGGGGEVVGHSNYGGGAGGGSGGAVILDSADEIYITTGARIDVSGGWPGEGKEVAKYTTQELARNLCLNDGNRKHKPSFCSWSVGDGGLGRSPVHGRRLGDQSPLRVQSDRHQLRLHVLPLQGQLRREQLSLPARDSGLPRPPLQDADDPRPTLLRPLRVDRPRPDGAPGHGGRIRGPALQGLQGYQSGHGRGHHHERLRPRSRPERHRGLRPRLEQRNGPLHSRQERGECPVPGREPHRAGLQGSRYGQPDRVDG